MVDTRQVREVSPLPPGRYWLMVNGPANIHDFDQWVRDMAGSVRVESSEGGAGDRLFVIFNVPQGRFPFLNAAQFGFPNTAPASVKSSQDVEQVPEPVNPSLSDLAFGSIGSPLILLVVAVLLLSGSGSRSSARRRYA